jgi:hypothetical protein
MAISPGELSAGGRGTTVAFLEELLHANRLAVRKWRVRRLRSDRRDDEEQ